MGFTTATHPTENIRQQDVLTRLVGLPSHGSALELKCFVEPILAQSHVNHKSQRLRVMDIEPARATQGCVGQSDIPPLRIEPTKGDGGTVVPPVCSSKILHQMQCGIGALCLTENFRFHPNECPDFRKINFSAINDRDGKGVIVSVVSHPGEI